MKKIIWILIFFFIGILGGNAETTTERVEFVRCVDGDTAVFMLRDEEVKFRFLAVDTPETVHPTKDVEAYGKNASEYTCNKLSDAKEIMVEYESSNNIDKYNRHLAWIWVDGSLLQKELISIGYAEVAYIYGEYRYTESLCLVQKKARDSAYGMWSENKNEGYCSTIDLTDVEDNIDYSKIENSSAPEEPDYNKINETQQKIESVINSLQKIAKKIPNLSDNSDKITNFIFYAIIGSAIISLIYNARKNNK